MKPVSFIVFGIVLITLFSVAQQGQLHYEEAKRLLKNADSVFDKESPTAKEDSFALSQYLYISNKLAEAPNTAGIIFTSLERSGILQQTTGNQAAAISSYKSAIDLHDRFDLNDSLLFRPNLFLGNAYYFLSHYDSAIYYFKRAELLQQSEPTEDRFRLFNSLGALYFDGGNFQQSINYFSLALHLISAGDINYKYLQYALNSNIASALRQMHLYDSSLHIYKTLLTKSTKHDKDELLLNVANIYIEKNLADSALAYLNLISRDSAVDKNALLVRLGKAHYMADNFAAAEVFLQRAVAHSREVSKYHKSPEAAEAYQTLGDVEIKKSNYAQALDYYHAAIIQSDYDFDETDVNINPETFTGSFNSYTLFDNLLSKAQCLMQWQQQNGATDRIAATIKTYQSAFALLDYINKSFDNEQARFFIGQNAAPVYAAAVDWLLGVYEKDQQSHYLQTLLQWSERSKAVTLKISRKENQLKWQTGIPDSLLQEEKRLRNLISYLRHQTSSHADSTASADFWAQLKQHEVALSRLMDRFNDYPEYYQRKYAADTVNIKKLQQTLPGNRTAVLSFFNTGRSLLCFILDKDQISLTKIDSVKNIIALLGDFTRQLKHQVPGKSNVVERESRQLYKELIQPLMPALSVYQQLIVIPHKQLRYLPFEALYSGEHYLLEDFVISYQQAITFLQAEEQTLPDFKRGLAMAPFAEQPPNKNFQVLPASAEEVKTVAGTTLINAGASRMAFLAGASDAAVIHLATHAVTDNLQPGRSYIAFHPAQDADSTYKLYAADIPSIPLHNTQLLFLSACETGAGKFQEGEGILSLSRAFAEAGCANLITSLWKAEDRATAYISQRFYHHLQTEKNYAAALRQAKLDLLNDAAYAQFSVPSFWSHLIYVGNVQQANTASAYWLWWLLLVPIGFAIWFFRKRRPS